MSLLLTLFGAAPVLAVGAEWCSVVLSSFPVKFAYYNFGFQDIVAQQNGELAMVWTNPDSAIRYFSRSHQGMWLTPDSLPGVNGGFSDGHYLAAGSDGSFHLWLPPFYGRDTGGVWIFESFPERVSAVPERTTLAVGPSNTVGAVRIDTDSFGYYPPYHVNYYLRVSSGVWAKEEIMTSTVSYQPLCCTLAIGPGDTPYVGLGVNSIGGRIYRRSSTGWEVFASFPLSYALPALRFDSLGRLHAVQGPVNMPSEMSYRLYSSAGTLIQTSTFPATDLVGWTDLDVDDNNNAHIVGRGVYVNVQSGEVEFIPGNDSYPPKITVSRGGVPGIVRALLANSIRSVEFFTRLPTMDAPSSLLLEGRQTEDSIRWEWSTPPAGSLNVRLRRSSDGQPLSDLLPPTAGSIFETGLDPNTYHQSFVEVLFPGISTVSAPSTSVYTLANPPGDLSIFAPSPSTLALSWDRNNNPSSTGHRLGFHGSDGTAKYFDTTETNFTLPYGPTEPTAVTLSALNGSGLESPMSVLTSFNESGMTYDLLNGHRVSMGVRNAGPAFLLTAVPETSFPSVAPPGNGFRATGVGFRIPTRQSTAAGNSVSVSFIYSTSTLSGEDPAKLVLARYDEPRAVWLPLATLSDGADRRLSASTGKFGVFQVYSRDRPPETLGGLGVFPNPYRISRGTLSVVEVPPGGRVSVRSAFGLSIREMTAGDAGAVLWDGRDEEGRVVLGGVYSVRVEGNGEEKTFRLIVEK